ncbi:hypothetical protein A0J61_00112 [Choanephora cucurbitarum]|uniref:Uncharacterized protein n=1 Tax=Choanephora cucurbitarum TaxID=101091 RepID=A0A1C7NRW2_9FUNG|nr:hypothetical protein A0J61_00112 [Choanephora cucurbitarum]
MLLTGGLNDSKMPNDVVRFLGSNEPLKELVDGGSFFKGTISSKKFAKLNKSITILQMDMCMRVILQERFYNRRSYERQEQFAFGLTDFSHFSAKEIQ